MADVADLTEAERKALSQMEGLRDRSKPRAPISASFRDRMASATVDPGDQRSQDKPDAEGADGLVIFRP
jgi:hypothetical protein